MELDEIEMEMKNPLNVGLLTEFDLRHIVRRLSETGELSPERVAELLEERKDELAGIDDRIRQITTPGRRRGWKANISDSVRELRRKQGRLRGLLNKVGDDPAVKEMFEAVLTEVGLEGTVVLLD